MRLQLENGSGLVRYAICNETFEGWDHARVCKQVAELGYQGLEIAPFTLAPRITDVSHAKRQELRHQAEACGLHIIGLHWLLAKTEGLQLTAADPAVRQRTADYLVELPVVVMTWAAISWYSGRRRSGASRPARRWLKPPIMPSIRWNTSCRVSPTWMFDCAWNRYPRQKPTSSILAAR